MARNYNRVVDLEAFSKRRVFHGTSSEAARSIKQNGFDIKKAQDTDFKTGLRTVLGACVYFAPDYFKAKHIAEKRFGKDAVVLEYVLDTGNMLKTGTACYDWQDDYDTCYMIGKLTERTRSKDGPEPSLVLYDEIGVSYRVLKINLEFIACHKCKKNKSHYRRRPKSKKKNCEKDWTPGWYSWNSDSKKYSSGNPTRAKKKTQSDPPAGYREVKSSKVNLPDVISTKNGKYVAANESGRSLKKKKRNNREKRWRKSKIKKSQKTDSCEAEKNDDTYYIQIPVELLCPKGYAPAPAETFNSNASSEEDSIIHNVHEVNSEKEYTASPRSFAPENSDRTGTIETRAFRSIKRTNILPGFNLNKADPGKSMGVVSGNETNEESFNAADDFYIPDPLLDSGSATPPATIVNESNSPEGEMVAPESMSSMTTKNKSNVPSFVNSNGLFPNLINMGMTFQPINFVASPMSVVYAPPLYPLIYHSTPVATKADSVNFCLKSPGGSQMFGVLGEKGC